MVPSRSVAIWSSRSMCYRPTVFLGHVRLVALSFPQWKHGARAFQKCFTISFCTFSIRLRNLGSVYSLHIRATCGVHLYTLWFNSSSSCSWRVRHVILFLDPQDEVDPSISSSVVLCFFVLLIYIVVLVLVFCLCPSSVRVVATFPGTVLFPLLCSVLQLFA